MNMFMKFFYGMVIAMVMLSIGAGPVAAMPEGSYKKSCRNCTDDGKTLSCECSYNKKDARATLDYTNCQPGSLWNEKSKLMCSPAESFPAGSYKNSCANCTLEVRKEKIFNTIEEIQVLTCQCKMKNGNYKEANVVLKYCKKGSIRNEDGVLKCDQIPISQMRKTPAQTTLPASTVKKAAESIKQRQSGESKNP